MSELTQVLTRIHDAHDPASAEDLLPLVYDELRRIAALMLAAEKPGQTLQATALVHEADLRLVPETIGVPANDSGQSHWNSRGHFFAAAAEAMRRILVDSARRRRRLKRGGDHDREDLLPERIVAPEPSGDLLELDESLNRLAAEDRQAADLVKLRYFAGLTGDQAAAVLGIAPRTADFRWAFARAWLRRDLSR